MAESGRLRQQAADLLVSAYAGMLIVVVGVLIGRSARERYVRHRTVGPLP
jgi:hypothetical protein